MPAVERTYQAIMHEIVLVLVVSRENSRVTPQSRNAGFKHANSHRLGVHL
jgi:hypothetical protein